MSDSTNLAGMSFARIVSTNTILLMRSIVAKGAIVSVTPITCIVTMAPAITFVRLARVIPLLIVVTIAGNCTKMSLFLAVRLTAKDALRQSLPNLAKFLFNHLAPIEGITLCLTL